MDISLWWGAGNAWLCAKAAEHFTQWVASKASAKWRKSPGKSPYHCGYAQPDWMREAHEALGKCDEVRFKRLKLDNL